MKRCHLGAVLGLAGLISWTTGARGQSSPQPPAGESPAPAAAATAAPPSGIGPPPAPRQTDAKLGSGIGVALVGGSFIVGGALAIDEASKMEHDEGLMAAGVGMLTGGISATLLGLTVVWADAYDSKVFPHRSDGAMAAGIVLTTVGAAGVVGSSASWVISAYRRGVYPMLLSGVVFWAGAPLLAAGTGLWILGAGARDLDSPYSELIASGTREADFVMRSPAMMMAGIGLTLAGVGLTAVTIGALVDMTGGQGPDPGAMATGNIIAASSLLATGLPLALIGAAEVPPNRAYARNDDLLRYLPQISVGAGSATLRWTY